LIYFESALRDFPQMSFTYFPNVSEFLMKAVLTAESQVSPSSDVDPLGAATDRLLGTAGGGGGGGGSGGGGNTSGATTGTGNNGGMSGGSGGGNPQHQQQRSGATASASLTNNLGNSSGGGLYSSDFVREDQYTQHQLQVSQSVF